MLAAPPHGILGEWVLVLPEADYFAADGTRLEGIGVSPDIATPGAEAMLAVAERVSKRSAYDGALLRGSAQFSLQRWAASEQSYEEALRLAPNDMPPRIGLSAVYVQLGRWDDAFAVWENMLAAQNNHPSATYQIGRLAALSGKRLEAGEHALRAYLQGTPGPGQPSHANAHKRLGQILEARGNRAGARLEYDEAIRLDPRDAETRALREKLDRPR
jgi:pentatricopeptide repeat protein